MMSHFHQVSPAWQIALLIFSQFTVVSLAAGLVMLFRRRCMLSKQLVLGIFFVLNVALYVLMQLNSHINGGEDPLHLGVPYAGLILVAALSLAVGVWLLLSETQNRKKINHTSIKEAFDNLPTGVCFFNEAGLPVLCNLAMHRFSFSVCGKDVQFISDLESCLADEFIPAAEARKDGMVFVLKDSTAWHLEKRFFTHENGESYTQYIALNVTDLHESRVALTRENEQLRKVQADLKKLAANVVAVTREEEILNTKMRVHDEMGRCLIAAQKYLEEKNVHNVPDSLATSWQRAVSMLKYNNDTPDEDMLSQIRKTCEFMKVAFVQTGRIPQQEDAAYILTCAVRECVTNAVRYAGATRLYADFTESESAASVTVTNNGAPPEREIVEGGGLSTLRRRVERAGGTMHIQSSPKFQLTVTVPKRKAGVL